MRMLQFREVKILYINNPLLLIFWCADLLLLNRNGAKSVLLMARKCLERAEDIFLDVIEHKPLSAATADSQAPPIPTRNMNNLSSSMSSEEWRQSNGAEQSPTVRLVTTLSW